MMTDAEVRIEDTAPQDVEMASEEQEVEVSVNQTGAEEPDLTTIEPDETERTTFLEYAISLLVFYD